MISLKQLLEKYRLIVPELMPWDLEQLMAEQQVLLVDVREPDEFNSMHIENSINVPRGILETSCEWGYEDTIPELVNARDKTVIIVCRSGNRSLLAARTMQKLGYKDVRSLNTGLRGWNDYEQPLINMAGDIVSLDDADEFFRSKVKPEQMPPK